MAKIAAILLIVGLVAVVGLVIPAPSPANAHGGYHAVVKFTDKSFTLTDFRKMSRESLWKDIASPVRFASADGNGNTYVYTAYDVGNKHLVVAVYTHDATKHDRDLIAIYLDFDHNAGETAGRNDWSFAVYRGGNRADSEGRGLTLERARTGGGFYDSSRTYQNGDWVSFRNSGVDSLSSNEWAALVKIPVAAKDGQVLGIGVRQGDAPKNEQCQYASFPTFCGYDYPESNSGLLPKRMGDLTFQKLDATLTVDIDSSFSPGQQVPVKVSVSSSMSTGTITIQQRTDNSTWNVLPSQAPFNGSVSSTFNAPEATSSLEIRATYDGDRLHRGSATIVKFYGLMVDPNGGEVEGEGWYKAGLNFRIIATSPSEIEARKTRLVFAGWSGDRDAKVARLVISMDGPISIKANWEEQFYLRINSDLGDPKGQGWYKAGENAKYSVTPPLGMAVRDVLDGWSGDAQGSKVEGSILMDSPKVINATWRKDYTQLFIITGAVAAAGIGSVVILKRRKKPVGEEQEAEPTPESKVDVAPDESSAKSTPGIANIKESVRRRRESDRVMSAAWIFAPLLGIMIQPIFFLLSDPISFLDLRSLFMFAPIAGFVGGIIAFILIVLPWYLLISRRSKHLARDRVLREGLIAHVKEEGTKKRKGTKLSSAVATLNSIHSECNSEEGEKSAILWIVLTLLTFGLAGLYVLYFLTRDPQKHDSRQHSFMQYVQSAMSELGSTVVLATWKVLPSRSFVLYFVLTFITFGLFGLYWYYVLIKDFNEHFKAQWQFEDQVISNL